MYSWGYADGKKESAAALAAAQERIAALEAAVLTLANKAEATVSELLSRHVDGESPGTLGTITSLDVAVIEARAALAGNQGGGGGEGQAADADGRRW